MSNWTTGEVRLLRKMFDDHLSGQEMAAALPRHTRTAIAARAGKLSLSKNMCLVHLRFMVRVQQRFLETRHR